MQKKIRKILALYLIFFMTFPIVLTSYTSAVSEAQKPSYSIGNYWKYNVTYFDTEMNGITNKTIVEESNILVDSISYDCFVIHTVHTLEDWTFIWDTYIEKNNLTIVKEDYHYSLNGEIKQIVNTTYSPPFNELDFPLTVGKNWTTEGMKNVTTTIPPLPPKPPKLTPFTQNFSVVRTEKITVPAGEFDTLVIEYLYLDGSYEEYYSPRASGSVRESRYDADGTEIMRMELLESSYITPSGVESWVWIAIAIVVVAGAGIASVFLIRMRRRSSPA